MLVYLLSRMLLPRNTQIKCFRRNMKKQLLLWLRWKNEQLWPSPCWKLRCGTSQDKPKHCLLLEPHKIIKNLHKIFHQERSVCFLDHLDLDGGTRSRGSRPMVRSKPTRNLRTRGRV